MESKFSVFVRDSMSVCALHSVEIIVEFERTGPRGASRYYFNRCQAVESHYKKRVRREKAVPESTGAREDR